MFRKLIPTWYSTKVEAINFKYLKEQGITNLFFDLDNTIASYQEKRADANMIKTFLSLEKLGFKTFLISNNSHEPRVKQFADQLNCDGYLFNAGKPGFKRITKFINLNKLTKKQIAIVGDQLLTDVIMANSIKIKSVLVEPKSTKDLPITRINRIIDKNIRKILKTRRLLIDIGQEIV
jgi:uncharacterized protein